MFTKSVYVAAAALAASSLVSAQTSTSCNPLEKTCPNDPAFGSDKATCNWASGACSTFKAADGTALTYGSNGAVFSIKSATEAPTIISGKYIFFGRVDIELQSAPGAGIVTSAVLQSDDLDEIDLEWVGGDNSHVQSNYFSKGQTGNYDRGGTHAVSNPSGQVHTYSIEWTPTSLQWIIDGATVRTLNAADAHGVDGYPQTPMQIKLGTWVAGRPGAPQGTVEWAGGLADFSKGPFNAYYKSISITDYAGGSGPSDKSVSYYMYSNHDGTWQSIKAVGGSGADSSSSASSSSASSTAASTKTSSKASTKTSTSTSTEATTTSSAVSTSVTLVTSTSSTPVTSTSAVATPSSTGTNAAVANGVTFGSLAVAGVLAVFQLF